MNHNIDELQLPKDDFSFVQGIVQEIISKVKRDFEYKIKLTLKERLSELGYFFEDDYEFNKFCQKRITRVRNCEYSTDEEIYLDFKNKENIGTLLVKYSTEISYDWKENNVLNVTIGR